MKKKNCKAVFGDIFFVLVGTALYAAAINVFFSPNHIAPGGVGGLSTIINYKTDIPIGLLNIAINIPLFVAAYRSLGRRFTVSTGITTLVLSGMIEIMTFVPTFTSDRLLASIFGGVLMGAGLGFVMTRGATSGGTDIVARIVRKNRPQFSIGSLLFAVDLVVVAISVVVYRDVVSGFYALIAMYIGTTVMDKMLQGLDMGKLVHIVSDESEALSASIVEELGRGVTLLHGKGFYSGREREVIMTVIRRHQIAPLRRIVKQTDPHAFIIFSDATEVFGEGFNTDNDN